MRIAKASMFPSAVAAACMLAALLTGCNGNPDEKKHKYLESGQRYFDKGQYPEAAIQFKNAIQVDPRFADAHYKLAQTDMKLGDGENFRQELETTIQLQPDYFAARLDLANLLVLAHNYDESRGQLDGARRELASAKEQLDWLVQNQPSNPEVFIARSNYNAATNNTAAAMADMQKAVALGPSRSDSYLSLAVLQVQQQQWDAAEANFKKAVELSPNSTSALVYLGNLYQTRGRFPEAEQLFRRAITAAPEDPNPRLSLAGLFAAENKPGQAEEFLRQSKKDFPTNSVGYRMLGDFYYANNQFDKATTEYSILSQDHPKDLVVKKNYIQLLILKDKLDEARKLNDEIIKIRPDDQDAQVYKGEIEIRSGKTNDAINTLQAVLKNDPDHAVAHYQLGLALAQQGNMSRAAAEWHEAVRLRPDNIEAHRALAGVSIQLHDPATLAQEATQIVNLQPSAPDGYLLRALAEIDRKQYGPADEDLHRSLEREPNNPDAYVQLGNLHVAQSQVAEAQRAFQQALDLNPNSTDAMGGLLNLDQAEKAPDRAIARIKTQLLKYPQNAGFHIMLGALLDQKKDLAGAEAEFKQAAEIDKKNSEAMINLGMVQYERGNSDQALQTYLDGSKVNPKEVRFYLLAGGIYKSKQDFDRAKQEYQKALEAHPDDPIASNELAYVLLEQGGNVDVAFAMAQTARRQFPNNPNFADTLGWAFYHKRVYTSAISLLKEAVTKDPENAVYNLHLGLAYAKNGQATPGHQQLERVMKINPKQPGIDELRQALEQIKG
jgi:tetratricopeptide (TPR) repeat protein